MALKTPSRYILTLTVLLVFALFTISALAQQQQQHYQGVSHEKRQTSAAGPRIAPAISSPKSNFMISPGVMAILVGGASVGVAGLMV
jgi:hypothetical protein